jgi:hypothetical protein
MKRAENKERDCQMCRRKFKRSNARFESICNTCVRDYDNQTLEDVLSMDPTVLDSDGEEVPLSVHDAECQNLIDSDLECNCGADQVVPADLDFSEAIND